MIKKGLLRMRIRTSEDTVKKISIKYQNLLDENVTSDVVTKILKHMVFNF